MAQELQNWLFFYGKELDREHLASVCTWSCDLKGARIGCLAGFRRSWNVAVPNGSTAGEMRWENCLGRAVWKYLVWLNLRPAPEADVDGVYVPVTNAELQLLANARLGFELQDVTPNARAIDGRVFCYLGTEQGKILYEQLLELEGGNLAISCQEYLQTLHAYRTQGMLRAFQYSTDSPVVTIQLLKPYVIPEYS